MRYLPLNDEDRADMLARIGVGHIDALFADIPKVKRLAQDLDLPPRKTEMEVERLLAGLAAKKCGGGLGAVFCWGGGLQASCSSKRRSSDPTLRISHELYALSARNRARHIANHLRIPDPGRSLDLDGRRQRVDV